VDDATARERSAQLRLDDRRLPRAHAPPAQSTWPSGTNRRTGVPDPRRAGLDRHSAGRIVRKTARRAAIGKAVTPHTLRHAFITAALDAGVPLRDVQEAASSADPRTTMRYDRARGSLDRHAAYIAAANPDHHAAVTHCDLSANANRRSVIRPRRSATSGRAH
jgi:integrase